MPFLFHRSVYGSRMSFTGKVYHDVNGGFGDELGGNFGSSEIFEFRRPKVISLGGIQGLMIARARRALCPGPSF